MSEFEHRRSEVDVAPYCAPPAELCVEPESYAAAEPQAEPTYAAPDGATGDGSSVFDYYAEEPEDGQCIDPSLPEEPNQSIDLDEGGECIDPGPDQAEDVDASGERKAKQRHEMTPEEKAADKKEKLSEYATQSDEEKRERWAKANGKLSEDEWTRIQELPPAQQNQAMLQAGIDRLDYDDPRRAELEKIQTDMNGKNSRTGGAYATGTPQTGCGSTVDELLKKNNDPSKPAFPGYIKGGEREVPALDEKNPMPPESGDVFELQNSNGDIHGHAGTFCVASPDGKTWLTYDGGQQSRASDKQEIKLVTRHVSVDKDGKTIVGGPADSASGTPADNVGRPLSGTYDYQKMVDKYPALLAPD